MNNLILVLILFLSFSFRLYILLFVPLRPYVAESILFFDLLNSPILIPSWATIGLGVINLSLIILISKKIINSNLWFIPALGYALSPWAGYLEAGGSLYIAVLTFCLVVFTAFEIVHNRKLSFIILTIGSILAVYTSLLVWIMLPVLVFSLFKLGYLTVKKLRVYVLILILFCLPLIFAAITNLTGLKSIFSNQVSIFAEVGLINTVNTFRGETSETAFSFLGKFVENRYFYLSQHFIFNVLKHITPVTYFTPEFKMFDFSFNPPILFGFLFPFLFGLKSIVNLFIKNKWITLTILSLVLPSILSKNSPDLNRLILVAPAIFILIGVGFKDLLGRKAVIYKFILFITFILLLTQTMTVLSDVYFREALRLHRIKS